MITFGNNKDGSIVCLGLRDGEKAVVELPLIKTGANRGCTDSKKLVGETIVFKDRCANKIYEIKVVDCVGGKNPKLVVNGVKGVTDIRPGDLIKECRINNIVRLSANSFYDTEDYYEMSIRVKDSTSYKYFNTDFIRIKFNGDNDTVEGIKNSTWCVGKFYKKDKFYIQTGNFNNSGKPASLHNVVCKYTKKGTVIDHINGNYFDNRISNLREVSPLENSRNKVGCGFPMKRSRGNSYLYTLKINGNKIYTPHRKDYEQSDIDALIVQKHFNFKHREDEFYKIDAVDIKYKDNLIQIMEDKLNRSIKKNNSFIKNKYESYNGEYIKVFNENKDMFTKISNEDLNILDEGRIWGTRGYWVITINKINYRLNRYILGIRELNVVGIEVDHINNITDDNRRCNLIITTKIGNLCNKKSKGFTIKQGKFKVKYNCLFEYYNKHSKINKAKEPTFKTEEEALSEIRGRKWFANHIRPQFNCYNDFLSFSNNYGVKNIEKIYIELNFPDIESINVPMIEELIEKLY